jgi:nitrate/nitrite transporter NarK
VTEQQVSSSQAHPDVGDVPVGTLVGQVAQDLSTLLRQEIALAKVETKQEIQRAGKAGGALGGAGIAGWLAIVFVSLAVMFALGAVMPLGWAALIVAAVWGVVAAVLFATGKRQLAEVNVVPERTVETVKEDVRWMQNRSS